MNSKAYQYFGSRHDPATDTIKGRNRVKFWDDSEKSFLRYKTQTTNSEVGQFRMSTPITHDKVIAIYSQQMTRAITAEIIAQISENKKFVEKAEIANHLNEVFDLPGFDGVEGAEIKRAQMAISLLVRGTCIVGRRFNKSTQKIKNILEYDDETGEGKYEEKEKVEREIWSEIIRLENFYPGDIFISDIQRQPFIVVEDIINAQQFEDYFGKYKNAKFVAPFSEAEAEQKTFFNEKFAANATLQAKDYYVIRYYNKWADEYYIIINGVLMTQPVSPFPFKHKEYPFAKEIFIPLDPDGQFFYGDSMVNVLSDNQDVVDILWNMTLTQMAKSLSPVLLVNNLQDITDEQVGPYGVPTYQVSDASNTKNLEFPAPNPTVFNILNYAQDLMEKSSISAEQQGAGGENKTATQVIQESERAQEIQNAFVKRLGSLLRQLTVLKMSDIFQFMLEPKLIEKITGATEDSFKEIFNEYTLNDTTLSDNSQGDKILRIRQERNQLPDQIRDDKMRMIGLDGMTSPKLEEEEAEFEALGKNVEIIEISTDFYDDFKFVVKTNVIPLLEQSKAIQRLLFDNFTQKMLAFFPDITNRQELQRRFIEINDESVEELSMPAPQVPPGMEQMPDAGNMGQQALPQGLQNQGGANVSLNDILGTA